MSASQPASANHTHALPVKLNGERFEKGEEGGLRRGEGRRGGEVEATFRRVSGSISHILDISECDRSCGGFYRSRILKLEGICDRKGEREVVLDLGGCGQRLSNVALPGRHSCVAGAGRALPTSLSTAPDIHPPTCDIHPLPKIPPEDTP